MTLLQGVFYRILCPGRIFLRSALLYRIKSSPRGAFVLLFLFLLSILYTGCSWFSDYKTLSVDYSHLQFPWEAAGFIGKFSVVYPDPLKPGTLSVVQAATTERVVRIRIKKGPSVPVAVYPGGSFKPSGAIFPMDMSEDGVLIVKSEKGFIAELLLSLVSENTRVEAVNVVKLQNLVMEKSGGDPWSIDPSKLRLSIVLGSLSSYKVKVMDAEEITILNAPGKWTSDNPFLLPVSSQSNGTLSLNLYPGISSFYNSADGKILSVSVSGDVSGEDFEYIISQQY